MLVSDFLERSAQEFPDKEALVLGEQRLTFTQIDRYTNSLANALIEEGFRKQDRAAICLDNSVESVVSIFGILKAGGVFVVINPQVKPQKLQYMLNDCLPKVLITDSTHYKSVSELLPSCPSIDLIILTDYEDEIAADGRFAEPRIGSYAEIFAQGLSTRPEKRCIDIDLASLIYTTGSTGSPKGVMLTHLNMVSAAASITEYLQNTSRDIIIDVLPLSFDYGLYQVLMGFKVGATVILEKSFLFPYQAIELIMKERVTGWPIVPTIAAIILRLKDLDKYDFSSLRYISSTGQVLPPKHIARLIEIFPKVRIYSMYGLTECKRVSYLPPEHLGRIPASVGKAMPNTEAYIVDENGNTVADPGTVGELVVRGANVMKGYWNLPEETAQALRPGPCPGEKVLYTGDLFRMDEEGYLYFISRKDDIIKTAAEMVSPKEVENVLCEMDDVVESAVIGVDDDILGRAVKAIVALRKGSALTEKDILRHCSERLESFMVPKHVEFCQELPKSPSGKVRKADLVEGASNH
jgi:long-chain acyl-CoA synthetase